MIRPSDTVLHRLSGEIWVVCGVDHEKGELIPCGYPFPSLAKIADCELVVEGYHDQFLENKAWDEAQMSLFPESPGGCICGAPCGCYDG